MNAADRRKAKRRAFREGKAARAAIHPSSRMDATDVGENLSPYTIAGNRRRTPRMKRQPWGEFTKSLAAEFRRGWGRL